MRTLEQRVIAATRHTDRLRRVLRPLIVEVVRVQNEPFFLRKLRDEREQPFGLIGIRSSRSRIITAELIRDVAYELMPVTVQRTTPFTANPASDFTDPRAETPRIAESIDQPIAAQERLLREVFGRVEVIRNGGNNRPDSSSVSIIQATERFPIAGTDAAYVVGVVIVLHATPLVAGRRILSDRIWQISLNA